MKLYYDNLLAYMPDSIIVDGKAIPDSKLSATRKAMMCLSDFQNSHDISYLYESIRQVSIYSEVNIVDLMLSLKDVEIDTNQKLDDLLDIAAKNLFQTITPNYDALSFDYKYYSAILMYVAHETLVIRNQIAVQQLQESMKSGEKEAPQ